MCLCWEVPEVHRDDGRTPAAPRRSLASRNLPLFQMQHLFARPLAPLSFPDQHLQVGRSRIRGENRLVGDGGGGGIYTSNSAGLVGFFFFPDSCWSGRGQIRRRWHREIPGIPVFVVRNVALTDRTAAETRNALAGRWSWWSLGGILVLILIFSGPGLCTQYAVFAPVSLHVKNDSSHRLVCLLLGIDRKFVEKLMLTLIKLMSSFSVSAF